MYALQREARDFQLPPHLRFDQWSAADACCAVAETHKHTLKTKGVTSHKLDVFCDLSEKRSQINGGQGKKKNDFKKIEIRNLLEM